MSSTKRRRPKREPTCADLVAGCARETLDTVKYLLTAYRMCDDDYAAVGRLFDKKEEFDEAWPKMPRKGSKLRRVRDEEADKIEATLDAFDNDMLLVYRNYADIENRGGQRSAFEQYGLSFSYTERSEKHNYGDFFVWLLSWGGPSDEIQFYVHHDLSFSRAEYRYKDWFDGAAVTLTGEDRKLAMKLWDYFVEGDQVKSVIEKYNRDADRPLPYYTR
jgi:hypothetical protein